MNKNIRKLPPLDNLPLSAGSNNTSYDTSKNPTIIVTVFTHESKFHLEGNSTKNSEQTALSIAVDKVMTWHKENSKFFGEAFNFDVTFNTKLIRCDAVSSF